MFLIKLNHISKIYELNNKAKFYALNDINLGLPFKGLVSIVGKSGCGKSTLLNIMAGIDSPSNGSYRFFNKDMTRPDKKDLQLFLNKRIGIVFQHYYLLEDKDVLFNIILPLLIGGTSVKAAKKEAKILLEGIDFPKDYYTKKVKDLSGGEKQRVAILRSLINSPNVLFADEPTGALDSENSKMIMDLLKKISKKKLVVLVSHNKELVESYSDRIIEMKDGRIIKDRTINHSDEGFNPIVKELKLRNGRGWVEKVISLNLKKHVSRNVFSILSLSICLTATTLVLGFSNSSVPSINKEAKKRLDYGVMTIAKNEDSKLEGTIITLTQESRPSYKEIQNLERTINDITFTNNYDILINSNQSITMDDVELDEIIFRPIYNFSSSYIDRSLLLSGIVPSERATFNKVLINKKANELIKNKAKIRENINLINLKSFYESTYYTFDSDNTVIKDTFVLDKTFIISGVVDELDFLSSPIIYYSYEGYIKYLENNNLNNLSTYFNKNYTWKDKIDDASDNDELSSYSIRGFLSDISKKQYLPQYVEAINNSLSATSLALTVEESLTSLVDASTKGMSVFLIISIIGVILIIGILSFFSYTQDRKQSAVLSSLGASRNDIISIYLFENLIVGLLSFLLSILLSFPLVKLADHLLFKFIGINGMINFPNNIISKFKYDYFFLLLIGMIVIVLISTYVPIIFSKKISISKELKDE